MTRILALAALLSVCALAASEPALAAKGGFKGGIKPVPFRAHGLFRPVTPRTLSHTGLPAKFHGHHKKHVVQPIIVGLTGGGLALLNPVPFPDASVQPAIVPVGGSVGCTTEDVPVPGGIVGIIRC
ncbi:MAG TPA: hypothetical protein VIG34_09310 [Xanthobacteraceae bacterium]